MLDTDSNPARTTPILMIVLIVIGPNVAVGDGDESEMWCAENVDSEPLNSFGPRKYPTLILNLLLS